MYVCLYVHLFIHKYISLCIYIYMNICICMYIYMNINMYSSIQLQKDKEYSQDVGEEKGRLQRLSWKKDKDEKAEKV
jgi:hypothetical protein